MMSATVVSAGAASTGYYQAEGYYTAGTPEAEAASQWFGQGAGELGLTGQVDDTLFTTMLEGQTWEPDGEGLKPGRLMGRIEDGERKHRPGLDLTFSAPKSVSIAALLYGDERVFAAHDKAVRVAMSYVESELVQTRRSVNGDIEVQNGGKIIAGLFRHDTSRLLDPQLHTHAVVANMVRNPDGSTTALHNDMIFAAQKLGSEIYRNDLARELGTLGYTVERTGKDQLISIREVPKEVTETFSKRRAEIEAALSERGMDSSAKSSELAALATRTAKHRELDRDELRTAWEKEAEGLGLTRQIMDVTIAATQDRARFRLPGVMRPGQEAPAPSDAVASLHQAIAHLSENNVHYREADLVTAALGFARSTDLTGINKAIAEARAEGTLLPAKVQNRDELHLTDRNTLQTERSIARLYRQGSRTTAVMPSTYEKLSGKADRRPSAALDKRLERTTLTDGQREAVRTTMTGRGRVVGVQGYAGTGKTFALAHIAKEAERAGYTVEGVAPSTQAVRQLQEALPASETLQARLLRGRSPDKDADPRKTILVVDEASMATNKQMLTLLTLAEEQKIARVVLVGDVQQLDGVGAGTPFALLQRLGMRTAVMDDIQRQRTGEGRAIVQHGIAGDVQRAFAVIGHNVQESPQVARTTAELWLDRDPELRRSTGIVTPTNKTRAAINAEIREGLREEGALAGPDHTLATLTPLRLTRAQIADPRSYSEGDIIIPYQSVASAGLTRGRQYEVQATAGPNGEVMLRDTVSGTPLPFSPAQNSKAAGSVEVYEPTERDFAAGDIVKFRITDKAQHIANGDTGTITGIDGHNVVVETADGASHTLPRDSTAALGLDHAYALTAHDFQGATVENILVAMSASETMADQKNFYVAVSRARDEITLVTDNAERLAERLERQTGEQITALEAWLTAERDRERDTSHDKENRDERDRAKDQPEIEPAQDRERDIDTEQREVERADRAAIAQLINTERGDFER